MLAGTEGCTKQTAIMFRGLGDGNGCQAGAQHAAPLQTRNSPQSICVNGSEGRRALINDGKGTLEGDADAAEGAFLEEAAD